MYNTTVTKLLLWARRVFVDANDGLGQQRLSGRYTTVESTAIARQGARPEHFAGAMLRKIFEDHGLTAHSAVKGESTWFGSGGSHSLIDYVAAPSSLGPLVRRAGVLLGFGAKLLKISAFGHRDHVPVQLEFQYGLDQALPEEARVGLRWNADALMDALQQGTRRREFVDNVDGTAPER